MNYLSVCSGIEAASVAWNPLGWNAVGFSEVEKFPCSVLAERFPGVTNYGDMNGFNEWDIAPGSVDLLVGGTPCQSFSIAGLRGGLEDDRGNLALTYCRILQKFKPRWFVWENVPGVLSSNGGRDFGSILGAMAELGYGCNYRVLDAQNFGVPQRRRRVFIVGYLGDWRRSAEVLFEPGCVCGDSKTSRKKRQNVTGTLASRTSAGGGLGTDFDLDGGLVTSTGHTSHCLNAGGMGRQDYETETMVVSIQERAVSENPNAGPGGKGYREDGKAYTLEARNKVQAIAYRTAGDGAVYDSGDKTAPLTTATDPNANIIAFSGRDRGDDGRGYSREPNVTGPITETVDATKPPRVAGPAIGVRRLTPRECERLQGFPDDWTLVQHRNKPACDGPRYKAIGNSMAVPVMRWIGERIASVSSFSTHCPAHSVNTT